MEIGWPINYLLRHTHECFKIYIHNGEDRVTLHEIEFPSEKINLTPT